jgi:hypothetical protein
MITLKFGATVPYSDPVPGPRRPYLPVRLRVGGVHFDTLGLVDSGSDGTLFHTQFALALGLALDPAAKKKMGGVGGSADVWYYDIELRVGGKTMTSLVGFSPTCPQDFGLLGRSDFFAGMRIAFEHNEERFHYHAVAPPPAGP